MDFKHILDGREAEQADRDAHLLTFPNVNPEDYGFAHCPVCDKWTKGQCDCHRVSLGEMHWH